MALSIHDLKKEKVGACVSGGLDSRTISKRLTEAGMPVVAFAADLGQPDETDINDIRTRMAPCGVDTVIVDLKAAMAEACFEVIEAQAMGRPVVAADLGGPVETVEHGVTGWRVKPGDPAALAAAIEHALCLGAEERRALGERARAAVVRNSTVRAMQDATLDVYEEVLGGKSTP